MANGSARGLAVFLALSLVANAFCAPVNLDRTRRRPRDIQTASKESTNAILEKDATTVSSTTNSVTTEDSDEDDDDFEFNAHPPPTGGAGTNIFTILNLANALFPASSHTTDKIKNVIGKFLSYNRSSFARRRQDILDNEIKIDYPKLFNGNKTQTHTFQRQESSDISDSETSESHSEDSDEDNGPKNSLEKESQEDSNANSGSIASDESNDDDSDYDEPPGGDGQGGGVLGFLAGLSGQDGDSDLGSLLAAVGGIVTNLSGDGVDINAVIATALGLFVGLLSEGNQNPGEIIASYLQTSLDTITGGGAKNNGAFFGKFISKLIKGISAGGDPDVSEENPMSDSGGFILSLIMSLLGDMSKSSFDSSSKPWR